MIDEDAGELLADRLVDEHGRDGAVDAAGQAADDPLEAHLLLDAVDRVLLKDAMTRWRGSRRCR